MTSASEEQPPAPETLELTVEMPPSPPLELTVVLAATREMGIGRAGTLPWTGLRKEMAYFARVTKRLPQGAPPMALNAVVMGRKTWDSIPPKFRPLKGRLNIVLSRSFGEASMSSSSPSTSSSATEETGGAATAAAAAGDREPVLRARSLPEALSYLRTLRGGSTSSTSRSGRLGRVFVIGGAQVYDAALALPEARRVLLTAVLSEQQPECDTFVAGLPRLAAAAAAAGERVGGWTRASKAEHDTWAGEVVPEGVQEEAGTRYEFQMWERKA